MLTDLRRKAVTACAVLLTAAGLLVPSAPLFGMEGPLLLKLGWTYAMAFPEITQASGDYGSGIAHGINTYRVIQYGGAQWYCLQLIVRKPGGGWYVPQGAPPFWVNINYALWVQEVVR